MWYWMGGQRSKTGPVKAQTNHTNDDKDMERDPLDLPCCIDINNITKAYDNSGRLAVDNLNLRIFQGQITALLGHNGAGKTTTMHMITG